MTPRPQAGASSYPGEDRALEHDFQVANADKTLLHAIVEVQHQAFTRVSFHLGIPATDLPPLTEGLEDLERMMAKDSRFFVALQRGSVIGAVRAQERNDGTIEIGRLAVASHCLRMGVASALMREVEEAFSYATRFEVFTGADAEEPLKLYARLGYQQFKSQRVGSVDLVWLEKYRGGHDVLPVFCSHD